MAFTVVTGGRFTSSNSRWSARPLCRRRAPTCPSVPSAKYGALDWTETEISAVDAKTGKKTLLALEDKENLFLDAMNAYFAGKPLLSDDEFELLKNDLTWQGSPVASLTRDEYTFLNAARAYAEGKPTGLSDGEYDALKKKLREENSVVAITTSPRCSLVTQTCWTDCVEEKGRKLILFLPAAALCGIMWSVVSFEFTPLRMVNPLMSLIIGSPLIFGASMFITRLVVPDPFILSGECPNCSLNTRVLFGDVLGIPGHQDKAELQCQRCGSHISVDRNRRQIELVKMNNSRKPSVVAG